MTQELPGQRSRQPFRDNPRLILAGIGVLVVVLLAIAVANRSPRLSPDFLTELVLSALSAADLSMIVALAFVLARNVIKLVVERRRGLPFAQFRAKLVALLLGMTLIPAVLVLLVGSELIRASVDRWFNAPMDDVLSAANQIAGDYYQERQAAVRARAATAARALSRVDLASADTRTLTAALANAPGERPVTIQVYAAERTEGTVHVRAVGGVDTNPPLSSPSGAGGERLAETAASGAGDARAIEALGGSGDLVRAAAPVRAGDGRIVGAVVVTDHVPPEFAARSRRLTQAFESYSQLRVFKRPLTGVYLSFFLMVTLLILVGSTWMGLYLAKRITRPVQRLAAAAREIGAGRLDQRIEAETSDEFGQLVEAFNTMAGELSASRQSVERSTIELQQKHVEVEARRRYIETILERIATGVVSIDRDGRIATLNESAARLLSLPTSSVGESAAAVFARPDLQPLAALLDGASKKKPQSAAQEIAIAREGQEVHLAAVATPLVGNGPAPDGVVLVIDDVTPLIHAQKVAAWREVARRLAHEIKNPLTPIQLSAERLRRHFSGAPEPSRVLVDECTTTIVGEVESLKGLVDEFSQFARMRSPRTVPADLGSLIVDTMNLYDGLFSEVRIETRFAGGMPLVRLDADQIRRVLINLVDNAIEATSRKGRIAVETELDSANNLVRVVVADDGPGIPPSERDKLFLPYYSTKRRGSGLGLAIVRRIVAEHGGSIEVGDNLPRGTRFTIELPC